MCNLFSLPLFRSCTSHHTFVYIHMHVYNILSLLFQSINGDFGGQRLQNMSSMVARTGRHRQRYQDKLRLVAGCIPYKLEDRDCNMEKTLLVLMVSTPNRDDLVFPKGGWEDDETIKEAACREAMEEAGIRGVLSENALGVWEFRSKSKQNSSSKEGGCRGYMFALKVTEELDSWAEKSSHQRKWLVVEEAFRLCRYDWMRDALEKFLIFLTKNRILGTREKAKELAMIPVSDSKSEHQMLSPSCSEKASVIQQHLEDSSANCAVHG